MEFIHEDYLGDGVYALFDGCAIWLRANDVHYPSDEICLEPDIIRSLFKFNEHCDELIRNQKEDIKKSKSQDPPNCYKCKHRGTIPGDCHSSCSNLKANVVGDETGINGGWFFWPFNFDPQWLLKCDGFKAKEEKSC